MDDVVDVFAKGNVRKDLLTVTVGMVALNIVIFLIEQLLTLQQGYDVIEQLGALYVNVSGVENQYYRLFTSMFLHSGIRHIGGNMVSLLFLGISLERVVGHGKMAIIYIVGGLAGGIVAYLYYALFYAGPVSMVGASGAIFAVIGVYVYVLIRNRRRINRSAIPRFILYIALSIYMGATTTGISLSAHLGGLVAGFLLSVLLYHPRKDRREVYSSEG